MSVRGAVPRGVLPVVSTPFDAAGEVDDAALAAQVAWLAGHGVDGVVLGMVSELLRLDDAERRHVVTTLCSAAAALPVPLPVVVAVGAESTRGAVAHAVHAASAGAAGVMAAPPIAVALPDEAIARHYRAVVEAVDVPVVVQDASGYVGRPLPLPLYLELLDAYGPERVLFKPEAEPIGPRLSALRDASGGTARIYEGNGGAALVDSHRRGVVGSIPGPEVPWAVVALWRALEAGDNARADALGQPLQALVALQTSLDAFVAVEKHLLVRQGVLPSARRREPHGPQLDPETVAEVERLADVLAAVAAGAAAPGWSRPPGVTATTRRDRDHSA